jgi:hypothetical protein
MSDQKDKAEFPVEKELVAHYEAIKNDYLSFTVTEQEMKLYSYEKFIKEISKQEILNKKGKKPTKLAIKAKELLERFK